MTATIIADSPDVGFPWVSWGVSTVGTITFSPSIGSPWDAVFAADPWALSPQAAALADGTPTAASIINAASPGPVTLAPVTLTGAGRVSLRPPQSGGGKLTFSSLILARRFGFSTVGPHDYAQTTGVTGDIEPVRGTWWAPHVGSVYGERDDRRVAVLEPMDAGQPAVSVWGSVRRGALRSPLLHRARIYADAMADSRYRDPAGVTSNGANLPATLEAALAAAAGGAAWRVHLRPTVYRDVWISDPGALASVREVVTEQDAGRRCDVAIPLVVVAP